MSLLMDQQERQLRDIVTQTVSVLCRNSLPYTSELSLRGLLAVTLDRSRVVLLDISDTTTQHSRHGNNSSSDDVIVVEPEPGEVIGGQKRGWREAHASRARPEMGQFQKELGALATAGHQPVGVPDDSGDGRFASPTRGPQELRACSADSYLPKPQPPRGNSNSDDYQVQCRVAQLLENAKAQMQEMGPLCALMQPGPHLGTHLGLQPVDAAASDTMQPHQVKDEPQSEVTDSHTGSGDVQHEIPEILGQMALVIKEEVTDDCVMESQDVVEPVQLIEHPSTIDWRDRIQEIVDSMRTPPGTEEEYEDLMERTVEQVISSCEIYSTDGKVHCPICNERLRSLYHLRRHLRTHVRTSLPYPSGSYTAGASSEAVTSTTSKVSSPTEKTDPKAMTAMKCNVCGLMCKCRFDLQKHMYIHTGEKPHSCVLCGKGFRQSSSLNVHMKQHFHGEKPYKCATCGKGFRQSSHLNVHRLVHTGERPHVCRVCQRGFSASSNLRKHMLSHTGERPFRCSHCGMAFTYLPTLKSHVLKQCGKLRRKKQAARLQVSTQKEEGSGTLPEETNSAQDTPGETAEVSEQGQN